MANVPTLEGQTREYLYAQIKAYREKRRPDPVMQANVATLSDKDMRDLADYFSSRKPVRALFQLDPQKVAKGESKVKETQMRHMPHARLFGEEGSSPPCRARSKVPCSSDRRDQLVEAASSTRRCAGRYI
jgi:hypothetical protein